LPQRRARLDGAVHAGCVICFSFRACGTSGKILDKGEGFGTQRIPGRRPSLKPPPTVLSAKRLAGFTTTATCRKIEPVESRPRFDCAQGRLRALAMKAGSILLPLAIMHLA